MRFLVAGSFVVVGLWLIWFCTIWGELAWGFLDLDLMCDFNFGFTLLCCVV